MNAIWINIQTSAGVLQGDGPILTATNWQSVNRLDRAGQFNFDMAASDPHASVLAAKLVAKCYGIINSVVTELGAGIIDSISLKGGLDNEPMLTVSGDNLLRELTYRSVHNLVLKDTSDVAPSYIDQVTPVGDVHNQVTPAESVTMASGDYIYYGYSQRFNNVILTLGAGKNNNLATWTTQYYNGSTGGWTALTVTDGTDTGGATWAKSGTIAFTKPDDWAETLNAGQTLFWIRMLVSAALDATDISAVTVNVEIAQDTDDALDAIMALAPAGWTITHSSTSTVYAQFSGENLLEALIHVAEQTGEHFRLGTGKQVVWLETLSATASVRAIRTGDPIALESNTEVCLVSDLQESAQSYDLITRIYPYGSGQGLAQVTLVKTDKAAPAGYTLSAANNYIKRDAAEVTYGQIDGVQVWSNIEQKQLVAPYDVLAANALFGVALKYLQTNSDIQRSYSLSVVKLDVTLVPGNLVHLVWRRAVDSYVAVNIDRNLYVLETTTRVDESGVRTVALQVSTVDTWPPTDTGLLVGVVQANRQLALHQQPVGAEGISSPTALNTLATATGAGNVVFRGALPAGGGITGASVFVPLNPPLTSTDWDGDAFSTTGAPTQLDLSSEFGCPAGITAVLIECEVFDSDQLANDCYLLLAPDGAAIVAPTVMTIWADQWAANWHHFEQVIVPCDKSGDIYYAIVASGAGTFNVKLEIWGYWIAV
jgi:hypothetical protein